MRAFQQMREGLRGHFTVHGRERVLPQTGGLQIRGAHGTRGLARCVGSDAMVM